MKILVVQDWLRSGGTERQSVLLAGAFADAGHGSTLVTFRPGGRLAATIPVNVQHQVLQPRDLRLDWFAPGLLRAARHLGPDVVLCMGRMANCHGARLQRALPDAAVIATLRTGKPLPWLFRRSLRSVRHIVANSHDAARLLREHHAVPAGRITVIHNSLVFPGPGTSLAGWPPAVHSAAPWTAGGPPAPSSRAELRRAHHATDTTSVLLCVAMFRPEKNQRALIDVVSRLPATPDVQLWLAGEGPARAACERRAADLGVTHRVKFVGFHRDPTALYAAADVAVHASWSESLSNFLIEAQAQGLPAVAYEAQGISECFVPGETGWAIPREDGDAFAARLVTLAAESAESRRRRSDAARAFARSTFDPARQVRRYLDLFTSLRRGPP